MKYEKCVDVSVWWAQGAEKTVVVSVAGVVVTASGYMSKESGRHALDGLPCSDLLPPCCSRSHGILHILTQLQAEL